MASRYKFSDEQRKELETARRECTDKRAMPRLEALVLRARGATAKEVAKATGFHAAYVSKLVQKYRLNGIEAITGNHYGGNHRNMSFEEEAAILAPFRERMERGEPVEIREISRAYQQAVSHTISNGQIYVVLYRHGWERLRPRAGQPQTAGGAEVAHPEN